MILGYKLLTFDDITPKKRVPKIAVNHLTSEGINCVDFLISLTGENDRKLIHSLDFIFFINNDNKIRYSETLPDGYELLKF
jgi:hypothetical protein